MAGTTADNVLQLHKKYGEAVRISPNEVSFISGETAWQDIYGLRIGKHKGHLSTQKDRATYAPDIEHANIITSNDEDHARIRKTLSHAFSERALAQQESLVQGYVDLLVSRLKDVAARESGKPQDITKWYNWVRNRWVETLPMFKLYADPSTNLFLDYVRHHCGPHVRRTIRLPARSCNARA